MERVTPADRVEEVLGEAQRAVMTRVLAEEGARREHVVVYLSGAHAYGFPSPDSDLDLKAIHIAPTSELLGFEPPSPTVDRAEVLDGIEIDYTSNELAHALSGILAGNGNFLERALGRMVPFASPLLDGLRAVAKASLSRRVHRHYRGFAQNQRALLDKDPTAKKLLYVLRTALTGIHLLETGALEPDLTRLMDAYALEDAIELIVRKRAGERIGLDAETLARWRARLDALFARLDAARARSPLPEDPPNEREAKEWLLSVRRARL